MEISLKDRISEYLLKWKQHDPTVWIHKSTIEELAKENGYLADNATRRLRELVAEQILEHRPSGKSQEFRYNF